MKTVAVYMFPKSNEYSFLVGFFEMKSGWTQDDLLDHVAKIHHHNRSSLNIR